MKFIECFFSDYKELISFLTAISLFLIGYLIDLKSRKIRDLRLFKEFREPLIAYANTCIDIMTEAEGLCECDPKLLGNEFFLKFNNILNSLSSLRDKGKLIIPNTFPEKFGKEKAAAYQGFRSNALDCATAVYHLAISINYSTSGYNKKSFISAKTLEELDKYLDEMTDKESQGFQLLMQEKKIKKRLMYLPEKRSLEGAVIHGKIGGWSSKSAIVETKRQFVSIIQETVRSRYWGERLVKVSSPGNE